MEIRVQVWSKPCPSPTSTHINVVEVGEGRLSVDTPEPPFLLPLVEKIKRKP